MDFISQNVNIPNTITKLKINPAPTIPTEKTIAKSTPVKKVSVPLPPLPPNNLSLPTIQAKKSPSSLPPVQKLPPNPLSQSIPVSTQPTQKLKLKIVSN